MTGLLPLQNGAAAMIYGNNVYPNFAHLYDKSIILNPTREEVWNQDEVTYAYGFHKQVFSEETIHDDETFDRLKKYGKSYKDSSFCILALTVDSHSPFNPPQDINLDLPIEMPQTMRDYMNCLHFTDSCFGQWYNEWNDTEQVQNTILVITGDHTVFKEDVLREIQPFAQKEGLSISSGKTYCPLIIQAPCIEKNIQVSEICYQMDVYPTIIHLIGAANYGWQGFGVNLLDSVSRSNRPISEQEAYFLSDKMIRINYFKE